MLQSRPRGFLRLAIASAPFWLLYECANLRLANWYYVGIPDDPFTRSIGVFLSYATVLPGVLEIAALVAAFAPPLLEPHPPAVLGPGWTRALLAAGAASLVLPFAFPRTAYPLIWGAAFLLLEPWLASRDGRSQLASIAYGDRRPLLWMLAAGLATGLMWETWNWRSPAKWIYTVPLFEEGKLFEMPYLGFVGFLPFALGCHSFARALVAVRWIPEWDPTVEPLPELAPRRTRRAIAALLFSALAIAAVNRFTIHATRPTLADVPGLGEPAARRLEAAGIRRLEDLVAAASSAAIEVDASGVEAARLMTVRGMGRRGLDWLAGAGIRTVADLAAQDPVDLQRRIAAAGAGPDPVPSTSEVRVWVFGARREQR